MGQINPSEKMWVIEHLQTKQRRTMNENKANKLVSVGDWIKIRDANEAEIKLKQYAHIK